jgi:conjugative relaxase-like TrwC/TraI family protein
VLRVTTIYANTAGASARYYTRYLADDGPDGEGRWLGRQADGLGLSGTVATEDLEALLSGHDPVSGTRLGRALVDRYDTKGRLIPAVAGFDATFSAPKSVSVWWGLTGDPGVVAAHDVAVRAVLEHLERYGATTRVRRNGVRQHPDAGGLVMAGFGQATSREDDPQLHTHVVVSAKVQTPDGRWMALDARYLKRHQRALGGLYQSVLRAELTHRYGVAWGPVENSQAEIAGIPRELLDAFSKRTAQVDAALADKVGEFRERQGRDPSVWERAALTREAAEDTRAAKTHASGADLAAMWREEAAALGWTPNRVVAGMRAAARTRAVPKGVTVPDVIEVCSTKGSSWTRADVLQAICDLAPLVSQFSGPEWADALEQACDRVIAGCVSLDPPDGRGPVRASDGRSVWLAPTEPHLTHEGVLVQEERIVLFAAEAHDAPPRPSATVEREGVDVLQADAAAAVAGHDGLVLVVGPAGTGKTTALRHAVADLARQGRPVFGVAPTAKAAKVLRDETAMPADTVAKLLHEWRSGAPRHGYRLPARSTLVVDEAGMVAPGRSPTSLTWPCPSGGDWCWSAIPASSRRSAAVACSTSCAAPAARMSSPPSTASGTVGNKRRRCSCGAATPTRSTSTSATAGSPLAASRISSPTRPAAGSPTPRPATASPWSPKPTNTSTPSTPPSRRSDARTASSVTGSSVSPAVRPRQSATWWPPAVTIGRCAPIGASPSATAISGPSSTSAGTAASPCPTETDTAK